VLGLLLRGRTEDVGRLALDLDPVEPGRSEDGAKYRNAGQTCVCANPILVQDGVYDAFTKRLTETAGAMKVADGFEPGAVIGPLIDIKAVENVEAHIADALKKGAKVVIGHKRAAQGGSFFEPTVLTDVTTDKVITKKENLRPRRSALPLHDRCRGHQDGQRDRVRPCRLFLRPRHRPHLAGHWGSKYGIEEFFEVKYLWHERHRPLSSLGTLRG
jgi:hypothetical protein